MRSRRLKGVLILLMALSKTGDAQDNATGTSPPGPLKVGLRKQLLVDDLVIAERKGVTRELGQAVKANGGKPIFPDCWWPASAHWDGGRFKMWYIRRAEQNFRYLNDSKWEGSYAESADGLRWTKKADVDYKPYGPIFIDAHETDPAHKFKSAPVIQRGNYLTWAVGLAHSGDGIRWKFYNNQNPVTGPFGDFTNQILWDEESRLYHLITREMPLEETKAQIYERGVRVLTNPDVKADPANWTTVSKFSLDREGPEEWKRRQIYHMSDWIHEGIHFGILAVFEWPLDLGEGKWDTRKRHERNILNFYIAPSRDGVRFNFDWVYAGKALIERGPDGSFDKDAVYPCPLVVTHADKHWIYYSGANERHDAATTELKSGHDEELYQNRLREQFFTGLATLRLDGFVCLSANGAGGVVETRPFTLEGGKLELNVDATKGDVRVEVLDEAGAPIESFGQADATPIAGVDKIRATAQWQGKGDLSSLKQRVIRLRFHLKNARLYAFQIQP